LAALTPDEFGVLELFRKETAVQLDSGIALRSSRVLVIDDERHITRLVEFILSKQGYAVATANSAEQALASVDEFRPDAILLDLGLPGMSGIEAIHRLRSNERYTTLPIMVLSARSFEHVPQELREAGATYLWAKPIAPSTLVSKLQDCGIPAYVQDHAAH
jgi:DNA-binding response OmpR family regulator